MSEQNKSPAWGYHKDHPKGKIFEDGKLPQGWVDTPAKLKNADKSK
ncbi:hypothetical protein [Curvivirga aplysinae]|nr:hypothetical protein [Curvivirga aplysinae]